MQIYESVTKGRYQTLIGKTWNMFKFGRTPQQIAVEIKQPVEKIVECIDYCIKGRQQFIKSKTCGGCIYDKENCECPEDCVRDDDGHYTKYIR